MMTPYTFSIAAAVQGCFGLEAIRSRCHVQTEGYAENLDITIALGPKIQCVASQQVKNLSEKNINL